MRLGCLTAPKQTVASATALVASLQSHHMGDSVPHRSSHAFVRRIDPMRHTQACMLQRRSSLPVCDASATVAGGMAKSDEVEVDPPLSSKTAQTHQARTTGTNQRWQSMYNWDKRMWLYFRGYNAPG